MDKSNVKQSIPQNGRSIKQPERCKYCPAEPEEHTWPPLCARHQDMAILISYFQEKELPISADSLKATLNRAKANGGRWHITEAEVDTLLAEMLREETE